MPGQQLVQMPDGKLHVLNNSQAITTLAQTGGTTIQVKLLIWCVCACVYVCVVCKIS